MLAISHRWFLLLGAALLLLAAPAGARAACGDYLHVGGDQRTSKPAAPTPKPCDGPHCSQRQLPPLPPAPVPPTVVSDDLCCVVSAANTAPKQRSTWPDAAEAGLAIHTSADIFDPPR
jgi:hypothetical protein